MLLPIEFIFWFFIGLLIYIYLGYPLLLSILATIWKNKVDKKNIFPSVTLIISAYNEEEVIEEKIKNSLALDYPKEKIEILVASDCSTDNTEKIVERYQAY